MTRVFIWTFGGCGMDGSKVILYQGGGGASPTCWTFPLQGFEACLLKPLMKQAYRPSGSKKRWEQRQGRHNWSVASLSAMAK